MLTFSNGGKLVESISELPNFRGAKRVYADFETSSGDPTETSLNPWFSCYTAGLAITVDDCAEAYYIPVGHHVGNNLSKDVVADWWCDVIDSCEDWTNHNVKYDAHVSTNDLGVRPDCTLRDTITLSKIIDSDRGYKGGYGLDVLSKQWLREDIGHFEDAFTPYLVKNKDYGAIPIQTMAPYACQDVITNRRLDKYISQLCPEECSKVWNTETALTRVLFKIEQRGMRVNPQQLAIAELLSYKRLLELDTILEQMVGRPFRPHVNTDCFDVLCNQFGLPIMAWTGDEESEDEDEKGNASFDKNAMKAYLAYPYTPPGLIEAIIEYRQTNTFVNNFVTKFRRMNIDGLLHCTYNQAVRTGRLSCKEPNMQQNSKRAKSLIVPAEGNSIMSCDESQIEFRTIVHYIKDEKAIKAFNDNPDTDFHKWVAEVCGIKRRPAKTVNFSIAFGQGKAGTVEALSGNEDIMNDLKEQIDGLLAAGKIKTEDRVNVYNLLAYRKGTSIYNQYHATFPTMKTTAKQADFAVKQRGYVKNLYGRRRHIPVDKSHIGFNAVNQSSAADIVKEAMVTLDDLLDRTGIDMTAQVHDELTFEGPRELLRDPRVAHAIVDVMEHPSVKMRVPLRCSCGVSDKSWQEASSDEVSKPVYYNPGAREHLLTLKS